MIEVKVFAEKVANEIYEYLPSEFQPMECSVMEQQKNNGVLMTGISFHMPGESISPIVYMEPYYERIRQGESFEEVMKQIADLAQTHRGMDINIPIETYESARPILSMKLINTKANRKMLASMPHIEVEDLSLIFQMEVPSPDICVNGSIKITNAILKEWGVDKEKLYEAAQQNMLLSDPPELQPVEIAMSGVFGGMISSPMMPGSNMLEMKGDYVRSPRETFYVLSNKSKVNGAAVIMCPGVMEVTSRLFPEGFYILPSSVHETLIIPKNHYIEPGELGQMVREVNREAVSREEVLSDCIYEYDREQGKCSGQAFL